VSFNKILYVTTQLTGTWRYFSWCAYPNIWYARLQRKIINLLEKKENIEFFVKFYPNDYVTNPNLFFAKNNSFKMLNEPLVDILEREHFDLIITEACATTLLEILCTTSQVLVLAHKDFIKLRGESLKILSKRVFVVESEKSYIDFISNFLSLDYFVSFKEINDEFLFTYGIEAPLQKSEKQASIYINKILESLS